MAQGTPAGNLGLFAGTPVIAYQGPCLVKAIFGYNHGTSLAVIQLFDLARAPILGVDVPVRQFPIPFATTADAATNQIAPTFEEGIPFYNGLTYMVSTTISAGTGATGVTAGNVQGHLDFTVKA
jgi:hypothetical protein